MAIEERTISGFANSNGVVATDLLLIVANVGSASQNNRKIVVSNFFGNLNVNIAGSFHSTTTGKTTTNTLAVSYANTPASNTAVPSSGRQIWWDENYIYVVANTTSNTIKRAALSTFS